MISQTGSKRHRKGFLLFEVIIAVAILSSAIVLIMQGFITSMKAIRVSEDRMRAAGHLQEKMWEIEDESAREGVLMIGSSSGDFDDGFKWELAVAPVEDIKGLKFVKLSIGDRALETYIKAGGD